MSINNLLHCFLTCMLVCWKLLKGLLTVSNSLWATSAYGACGPPWIRFPLREYQTPRWHIGSESECNQCPRAVKLLVYMSICPHEIDDLFDFMYCLKCWAFRFGSYCLNFILRISMTPKKKKKKVFLCILLHLIWFWHEYAVDLKVRPSWRNAQNFC